jgi:hypothetical protein
LSSSSVTPITTTSRKAQSCLSLSLSISRSDKLLSDSLRSKYLPLLHHAAHLTAFCK